MKNLSFFLLLITLLESIRGDYIIKTEHKLGQVTFTPSTEIETHNDDELKKCLEKRKHDVQKFTEDINESQEWQRKSRVVRNSSYNGLECVSCYGSGPSTSAENCYKGAKSNTQRCADNEKCFTEIHPLYIKRGCTIPDTLNKTIVCRCHQCNAKHSNDLNNFEYSSIADWESDSKRLSEPSVGINLLCKFCVTRGVNHDSDEKCKEGRNIDVIQCGHKQLCFTNIDKQINFVSRGCIDKPAFNVFHVFCEETNCNNESYPNPQKAKPTPKPEPTPKQKLEPKFEPKSEQKLQLKSEPKLEPKPEAVELRVVPSSMVIVSSSTKTELRKIVLLTTLLLKYELSLMTM